MRQSSTPGKKVWIPLVVVFFSVGLVFYMSSQKRHKKTAQTTDQANIQGAWLGQSESQNGIKWNVNYLYEFVKDKFIFTDETGKVMTYSFKLDTSSRPKLIIVQPADTPADSASANSAPVSVGYELKGDSLKIVVAPAGLQPTDISDKNNQELILCKRKGS